MSRSNFSEKDRKFIFQRDGEHCRRCHKKLEFKNRRRNEKGAWEMGHRRAHADGGTSHLRNIVALCWKCNLEMGTKNYASSERDMEYNSTTDKVKSFLNDQFSIGRHSFDLSKAKRSRSNDAELEDFHNKLEHNSPDWAKKQFEKMKPLVKRYENAVKNAVFIEQAQSPYEKYYVMTQMILKKYGSN